ncbi:Hydroxysqualene synthase [Thauera sp. GDN1]|uniref:squalene synthase HpnC n=1 Tax=Thauera sp. GDN1 TaxID=2944810 RepID=UPI00247950FE|nr:squalene synthase HpnC [Thauera sp. GDN1]WEN42460.1 Hydroxysqualene synthase [Thauera sp. GDN1]
MPVEHYENFPVASLLLPARLREPVEAIYAFARSADDVADEGDAPAIARLARLHDYQIALEACAHGHPVHDAGLAPLFARLGRAIAAHGLPLQPLRDLLDAFMQDVGKTRYASIDELRDYCRRSADPVGRLMLHLYGAATAENLRRSDAICTALQLINFWQDVGVDWNKRRIYLPQDDMARFGVDEARLDALVRGETAIDDDWRALLAFEVQRARAMMLAGAPLARALPGRVGWELRLVVLGGLRILERIEAVGYDVFRHRPTLGRRDWLRLGWRALTFGKTA